MTAAPVDAVCIEPGCTQDATTERTTGVVPIAVDDDGFCWATEWTCAVHST